ncbi:MAG: hypothetical protein R3E02_15580 [Blastomonas sp.]
MKLHKHLNLKSRYFQAGLLASGVAILCTATFAVSAHIEREQMAAAYTERAFSQIELRASLHEPVGTLIIGDSITDSLVFHPACGSVLQATIPGITLAEYRSRIPGLIAKVNPDRVIIELGTNDDGTHYDLPALATRHPTALVGTTNKPGMNRHIARLATELGYDYIPMPTPGADGKHPDRTGLLQLKSRIDDFCAERGAELAELH